MKIYPDGHLWRPLNGSEVEKFARKFCDVCTQDEQGCSIPYRILSGELTDNSPWIYQNGEPICLDFEGDLNKIPF